MAKKLNSEDVVSRLESMGAKIPEKRKTPLWGGPSKDGITFSLLSRFLSCRERFRLLVVEGLKPNDQFNHRLEYGNLWHLCEEWYARGNDPTRPGRSSPLWPEKLREYCQDLCRRYPTSLEQVTHWYEVCKAQFPVYVEFWKHRREEFPIRNLMQEVSFNVSYPLPSGRSVRLRGKWDSVDQCISGEKRGIWLQENKTKGDIREGAIQRQLKMDLQTMMYMVALCCQEGIDMWLLRGVRYNVVRRPLGGGRHSITRHKATKSKPEESRPAFYQRLKGLIEGEPDFFFMRWEVPVFPADIKRFRIQVLDPILEQLCDWWEWINRTDGNDTSCGPHWRHPYGVYNPMDEGGFADVDEYLDTGSEAGLQRCDNLFPELT